MHHIITFILIIIAQLQTVTCKTKVDEIKNLLGEKTQQINPTQQSVIDLSNHWIDQAFSALIATVANEKISKIAHFETKIHENCVKKINSVEEHAKCVDDLLEISRKQEGRKIGIKKMLNVMMEKTSKSDDENERKWIGAFRIRKKRQTIVNRDSYTLKTSKDGSPFTMIAKQITKSVRALKNKKEDRGWRQIIVDVKKQGEVMEKRKKVREMLGKSIGSRSNQKRRTIQFSPKKQSDQVVDPRRPLANMMDSKEDIQTGQNNIEVDNNVISTNSQNINAEDMFRRLQEHPEEILSDDNAPKILNMSESENEALLRIKLIRESVKLGLSVGGQNVSGFDQKSLRFASPRFFAVSPEEHKKENDTVNILSPSLFSLHDEGNTDEQKLSLPNILSNTIPKGGGEKDAWMDLLTELTGVADTVDEAAQKVVRESEGILMNSKGEEISVSKENVTNIYGEDNYRKMKVIEKIHGTYTQEQLENFNKTGYSIMTNKQREMVYGNGSPFENPQALEAGRNLTMAKARKALHTVIREIGKGNVKVGKFDKRMKDIVGSPILFSAIIASPATASQALILSPVLFTPLVLSPAIYGSVILSPWVFVPVILAPRILSPIIVSPAIFSPVILSPLALDPLVLVPGIANPVVLSPFILTPFILSPQVMTPIILSPFALSPFILTPTALSPLILSPFVLSPAILSPSFVTAVILSPYALSPSILSPPTMISVFASPSILS